MIATTLEGRTFEDHENLVRHLRDLCLFPFGRHGLGRGYFQAARAISTMRWKPGAASCTPKKAADNEVLYNLNAPPPPTKLGF